MYPLVTNAFLLLNDVYMFVCVSHSYTHFICKSFELPSTVFEDADLDYLVTADDLTLSTLRPAQFQDLVALATDIQTLSPAIPNDLA